MNPHGIVCQGRPGFPKPWKSIENHGKSTSNCTACTHMDPNHFKTVFCTRMHHFEVVLCTLLVPSNIFLGIIPEIWWKSIGSRTSGPLAEPIEKQGKSRKIKGNQWSAGWLASPKPLQPLGILEKTNKIYLNPPRFFEFLIKSTQIPRNAYKIPPDPSKFL